MSVTIPVAEVPKGIRKCKKRARKYFDTAKYLLADERTDEAYIITICGLEEVGRAVMLNWGLENSSGGDFIEIRRTKLYDHKAKQQAAISILSQHLKNLAMGTFDTQCLDRSFFTIEEGRINVLQDLRLRAQYVDFTEGQWQPSASINPYGLETFIKGVEEEFESFLRYEVSYAEE